MRLFSTAHAFSQTPNPPVVLPQFLHYDEGHVHREGKMSDAPLLVRVANEDRNAVSECIDRFGGLVWSIARRLTTSTDEAEDAVQEIFIDLWRSCKRFDPKRSSEKTFVAMIARRRMIDRLRRSKRRPDVAPIDEARDISSDQHERIEHDADVATAWRLLDELEAEQRRVIQLSIYNGMSHAEIAKTTGLPLGTVKSHIRRGLSMVRERLQKTDAAKRVIRDG